MAELKGASVDLVSSEDINVPYCQHGPTLLFERFYSDKSSQRFFACAMYRSRKICSFYHLANNPLSPEKREQYQQMYIEYQSKLISQCNVVEASKNVLKKKCEDRSVCVTCGVLLVDGEMEKVHREHQIRFNLTNKELVFPTMLLRPQNEDQGQAQYFFSNESQRLLVSEISRLKKSHVICLGVPRLHEDLVSNGKVHSFLLDIDHRFRQFYSDKLFQRFNMFNGFFYSDNGYQELKNFIGTCPVQNLLLVADPPFGGLLTALKRGIDTIWSIAQYEIHTLLVFPYFNERHVLESFPTMYMLDYQVTYQSHRHFNVARGQKRPSPVRIYTNLPLPGLQLPLKDGYRFCDVCNRYVHQNNAHCDKCNQCMSKDGRPYRHCDICLVCVKQSYEHCNKCGVCGLSNHDCDARFKAQGCHICGAVDHKRRNCPKKDERRKAPTVVKRKRSHRKNSHETQNDSSIAKKRKVSID